jgi:hypothetical protein
VLAEPFLGSTKPGASLTDPAVHFSVSEWQRLGKVIGSPCSTWLRSHLSRGFMKGELVVGDVKPPRSHLSAEAFRDGH